MDSESSQQEFSVRKLGTKSVTLYPTRAQIVRDIKGVILKPGANKITIIGLTPTCDEHSIKVDGTGVATVTDLSIELVPNPENFLEIYPDEDDFNSDIDVSEESDSEDDLPTGRTKEVSDSIKVLDKERKAKNEHCKSLSSRLVVLEDYLKNHSRPTEKGGISLPELMATYSSEREKVVSDMIAVRDRLDDIEEEVSKLEKEKRKLTRETRISKLKALKEQEKAARKERRKKKELAEQKQRLHRERVKFWPKKVYKLTISLETPSGFTPGSSRRGSIDSLVKVPEVTKSDVSDEQAEVNLSLSYITHSASWSPRYDLSLNTVNNTGVLDYSAELVNLTSETWKDARIVLSTSQSSYTGLSDKIPSLQPWHVRLLKGSGFGDNAALKASYEIEHAQKNSSIRKDQQSQVYQNRTELFGIDETTYNKQPFGGRQYRKGYQDYDYSSYLAQGQVQAQMQQTYNAPPPPPNPAPASKVFGAPVVRSAALFGNSSTVPFAAASNPEEAFSFGKYSGPKPPMTNQAALRRRARPAEEVAFAEAAEFEEDAGFDGGVDEATLFNLGEQALQFEESVFEESGLTTTYDLPSTKTLPPTTTATKHKIARVDFKGIVYSHICVPKLRAGAFLKARLRNSSKITLLKGTMGLTLDGSFLGQSTVPRCSAGESFTLNLGIDPSVTVGYARPTVQRSSSGLFTKESSEVFTRVCTITNTKSNAPLDLVMLEQIPVSEDERLRIDITQPRGLRIGGESVPTGAPNDHQSASGAAQGTAAAARGADGKKWGTATATATKGGYISYNVKLNPAKSCKIVLEYEAAYPGGEQVIAA